MTVAEAVVATAKGKKEVGTHTKCTLFIRNLSAEVNNKVNGDG